MPTENDSPVLEYELYAKDGDEWKPIGKVEEFSETVSLEEDSIIPLKNVLPNEGFTGTLKIKPVKGKFHKKSIRWFRKHLFIDFLPMMFPKKKNRRQKRINRKYKGIF